MSWGRSCGCALSLYRFCQQPQKQHFQPQARLHALAQLLLGAAQLGLPLQQAGPADGLGEGGQLLAELGRHAGEFQSVWSGGHQDQIPQHSGQTLQHGPGIPAPVQQVAGGLQQLHRFGAAHGPHQFQQLLFGDCPQQIPHRSGFDRCRQQAQLIQQAFRIPQASLGPLGHHMNGLRLDFDRFLFGDPAQMIVEGIQRNAPEIKALTTAQDCRQHPLRVCGG